MEGRLSTLYSLQISCHISYYLFRISQQAYALKKQTNKIKELQEAISLYSAETELCPSSQDFDLGRGRVGSGIF